MSWKELKMIYNNDDGMISIHSNDFNITFGSGYGGHGMQCQYESDTEAYDEILLHLDTIASRIRGIARLVKFDEVE